MKIVIPLPPRTKKNSQRIVLIKGHYAVIPSKEYKLYEMACSLYMPKLKEPIDYPVNVKVEYYMPTRRRVDGVNLLEATLDILVRYKVLADDNRNIVYAVDGTRVYYDKKDPRCEITIEPITGEQVERWKEK